MKPSNPRTFRIEADVDNAIEKIAKEERMTLNQVVNQALKKYVLWDRAPATRGMVSVPSMVMVKLMADQNQQKAHELGRWAGKELFLSNLQIGHPVQSLEKADEMMRMLGAYGRRFTFDHTVERGEHIFTIGQKMGKNWSAYYAGALEAILERFLGKSLRETVSANLCVVAFRAE